ncbi:tRNA (adenine(58)-N(1))-methyltransferase, mitochondrial isoform X1 [Sebastes umbrosus]|uniref:tRNA (adenine(58)-N(1))-methyltransferase, mitochondrial isoform X1 n=1 Tax=Sebastes umbrosus TaxID=72105 RepID=UPI00189E0474|nr:tRNA (adenine(58)-N(1))-methyltransferase, mitochondrial isoform X1 [Sebastes umbrosus]
MAVQMPFGLLVMHRLVRISTSCQRHLILHKCRREIRTFSTASVKCNENQGDSSDSSPLSAKLTSRQALLSRRRRPLSPLERISSLLPQDALTQEVMQLREQQDQQEDTNNIQVTGTQQEESRHPKEEDSGTHHASKEGYGHPREEDSGTHHASQEEIGHPREEDSGTHHASQEESGHPKEEDSGTHHASHAAMETSDTGESVTSPTLLPGESSLAFGELLVAEYRKKNRVEFRKMFELRPGTRLQSSWGIVLHDDIAGQPAGSFLKTGRGVRLLVRRASLEDYVLLMKRGPAIAYPKDAGTMLMMMDVTEGDRVLESGSGSGAMSLFLSRAVGCKGSVLSVEVREDHHKRAVLNYNRWRTSWGLRRGEEWPDNVSFHIADLGTASSLLATQGFHAVALDLINPHLVLPALIPHLHPGAVCAVYLANITQVIDLLEGLRCSALPLLCERIIEVPIREWVVAPALQKNGKYCVRKVPITEEDQREKEGETSDEADKEEMTTEEHPAFGSIPYIARPHPEQLSHTAFLVKLRKCVQ